MKRITTWLLENVPWVTLFLRNTIHYNCLRYVYFKIGPLVQLHTSASDCKCVGNIPGSQFVKAFSAPPSHF